MGVRSHGRRVRTCSAHQSGDIYRGGRRHHADMSVVFLITWSCRPRVHPGHKDYMKHLHHRYRRRCRHRFCRCVYAHPYGCVWHDAIARRRAESGAAVPSNETLAINWQCYITEGISLRQMRRFVSQPHVWPATNTSGCFMLQHKGSITAVMTLFVITLCTVLPLLLAWWTTWDR